MWIVVPIEYKRESPMLFRRWIRSVRAIASKPYNSVTVSSRFMQEYVDFTRMASMRRALARV